MHPQYRLVIAANRDEFYERQTRPAQFWKTSPDLLAGKDLRGGGTWMGITRSGRFGAITNYREPQNVIKNAPSRGFLVRDFLETPLPPLDYLKKNKNAADHYNGFNLIVGTTKDLFYYSNRQNNIIKILPGIHGLSNHLINTPWPKVVKGKQSLWNIVSENVPLDIEKIFTLLKDNNSPPDRLLPNTGVGFQWEKILSPIFITSSTYGTRSSTVLLWDRHGKVKFFERSFIMNGGEFTKAETREFCFKIQRVFR